MATLSNMTDRTFRPRLLTTAMASHSLVGCLCLWPAVMAILNSPAAINQATADHPTSEFWFSPELCRLIAGQLLGLTAGLVGVRIMLDKFLLKTVWIAGLAIVGCALVMTAPAFMPTINWLAPVVFGILGTGTAVLWQSGLEAVMATTPNFRRWQAMGWMAFAFCAACLVMTIPLLAIYLLPPGLLPSGVLPSSVPMRDPNILFIIVVGLIALSVRRHFKTTTATTLLDENATALNAAAAAACCDHHEAHDHDHDQHPAASDADATEISCGVDQCCGATQSCQTSLWIGVTLAACGWTLLLGTVNPLILIVCQPAANVSPFSSLLPLASVGLCIMLCVTTYRRLMQQTGNTLALPMFLSINLVLAVSCFAAFKTTGFGMVTQVVAAAFCGFSFACLHGCFSQVPEYFGDTRQHKRRTNALAAGAVVACFALLVASAVPEDFRTTTLVLVLPAISTLSTMVAMRSIRQPILVTRFAERFLAHKPGS